MIPNCGTNNTLEAVSKGQYLRTSLRAATLRFLKAVSAGAVLEPSVSVDWMLE
jgi:hypothetical protein